jgi:hypothetical protein
MRSLRGVVCMDCQVFRPRMTMFFGREEEFSLLSIEKTSFLNVLLTLSEEDIDQYEDVTSLKKAISTYSFSGLQGSWFCNPIPCSEVIAATTLK